MATTENNGRAIADIIIGKPQPFMAGEMRCALYPMTLAKTLLIARLMEKLETTKGNLHTNPYLEAMRLIRKDRESCCLILAYNATPNTFADLCNDEEITRKKNHFSQNIEDESLASMLIMTLTADTTEEVIKQLGIDEEHKKLEEVLEIKKKSNKNYLSFGGKTLFGNFIGQLKEMGYSDEEIIYERSYSYLRLMLADKLTQVYLTDEELQQVPTTSGGQMFDANNPASKKAILAYMKNRGVDTK